jgi:hypothetical protein
VRKSMLCGPRKRDLPSTLKMTRGNCHAILFPHIFWLRGRVGAIKDLKLADPAQIAFEAPTGRPYQPAAAGENEHIGEFRFTLPERSFSHANQRQKLTIGWHPGQPAHGAQTWRRRNATFRSALLFTTPQDYRDLAEECERAAVRYGLAHGRRPIL